MKIVNSPTQLPIAFAESGEKNTIPDSTASPDLASWELGFPPDTMKTPEEGGVPPHGMDFNGALGSISDLVRWYSLGGHFKYKSTFATASSVAGYPQGSVVLGDDGLTLWRSLVDDNVQDPNSAAQTQWGRIGSDTAITITTTGGVRSLSVGESSASVLILKGALTTDVHIVPASGAPVNLLVYNATDGNANVFVGGIAIGTAGDCTRIQSSPGAGLTTPFIHDQSVLGAVRCGGSANALSYENQGMDNGVSGAEAAVLFKVIPAYTNTASEVTMSINGGGALPVVNADGLPLPVGALQAGQVLLLLKQGNLIKTSYQLGAATYAYTGGVKLPVPGGLTLKWGTATTHGSSGTTQTATFDTPFENACLCVVMTTTSNVANTTTGAVNIITTTGFTFWSNNAGANMLYMAIGY